MATLFEGTPARWDIAEMDLAPARAALSRKLARLACVWSRALVAGMALALAGLDVAHAAAAAPPPRSLIATGVATLFGLGVALVGWLAKRSMARFTTWRGV